MALHSCDNLITPCNPCNFSIMAVNVLMQMLFNSSEVQLYQAGICV